MNLTDEEIIEDFFAWAVENEDRKVFPCISKEETSYYSDRVSENTYIMEYSFKVMPELKNALEKYSGLLSNAYMLRKLTIEICQGRLFQESLDNERREDEQKDSVIGADILPEFIYTF